MSKFQRVSLFAVAVVATVGIAYVLGVGAAGIVQKYRAKQWKAERLEEILTQMGTGLAVGAKLPDANLKDLQGNDIKLSEVVGDRTLVSFVSPDCGACKIEMDRISEIAMEQDRDGFVLISDSDPTELYYIQDSLKLHCNFMYDPDGEYKLELGVFSFPFSLLVNRSMIIEEIIAGAPETEELADIIAFNRK